MFFVFRRNEFLSTFNEYTVTIKVLELFKLGIYKVGFKMYLSCVLLKPHPVLFVLYEKRKADFEINVK
jgi:hypothetical protein